MTVDEEGTCDVALRFRNRVSGGAGYFGLVWFGR
jgi:hypothetical protein